jgi:hypothetical protein
VQAMLQSLYGHFFAGLMHRTLYTQAACFSSAPEVLSKCRVSGFSPLVFVALQSYLSKYDCLSRLKPGGVLVINATWKSAEVCGGAGHRYSVRGCLFRCGGGFCG